MDGRKVEVCPAFPGYSTYAQGSAIPGASPESSQFPQQRVELAN
jgi:hypothetical protein